jgi:hypothetical protein
MIVKRPFVWSTSGYNAPEVKANESAIPIAAALCRASIGTPEWYFGSTRTAKDQSFPAYWPQWGRLGIARCAYHFLINAESAARQARFFVSCVREAGGWRHPDKLCLDVEQDIDVSLKAILDWFSQVEALMPEISPPDHFLLYSRQDVIGPLSTAKLTAAQRQYLRSIPCWAAGYPDNPDAWTFEQLLAAYHLDTSKFGPTVGVQYAASAVVDGLSRPGYESIECNVFDPAYLEKWQAETEPGEAPMEYKFKAICNVASLNVRADHTTASTDIGDVLQGQSAYGNETWTDGALEQWLHVLEVNGQPKDGWIAIKHAGSTFCTLTELAPQPGAVSVSIELNDNGVIYKGTATLTKA